MMKLILATAVPFLLLAATEEIRYSYDKNGRLIRVDYGNGRVISYGYDAAGRLIRRTIEIPPPAPPAPPAEPESRPKDGKPAMRSEQ